MWLRRNHVSQETDLPRLTFWGNSGMRVAGDAKAEMGETGEMSKRAKITQHPLLPLNI